MNEQEMQKEIEELQKQNSDLEKRNEILEKDYDDLKGAVKDAIYNLKFWI